MNEILLVPTYKCIKEQSSPVGGAQKGKEKERKKVIVESLSHSQSFHIIFHIKDELAFRAAPPQAGVRNCVFSSVVPKFVRHSF